MDGELLDADDVEQIDLDGAVIGRASRVIRLAHDRRSTMIRSGCRTSWFAPMVKMRRIGANALI
jgi:hypothetical protein